MFAARCARRRPRTKATEAGNMPIGRKSRRPLPISGRAREGEHPRRRVGRRRRTPFRQARRRRPAQSEIVIEWPTRQRPENDPSRSRIDRADRPEPPKRPLQEPASNRLNDLDQDQAAGPSSSRTIPGKGADDLDLVPSDRGPDDPESSRTIPMRSSAHPSSGSSAARNTRRIRRGKTMWPLRTIHAAPLSNLGSTYPDEPAQGDGEDDDDWR